MITAKAKVNTMKCSDFAQEFETMLRNKLVNLDSRIRSHVGACKTCRKKFIAIRWEIAEGTRELKELKEFLGTGFNYGCDSSLELASDWNSKKRESTDSVLDFYQNTPWYIYNLTLWSACGQRPRYVEMATKILKDHAVKSILDFGAGVGTDALSFAASGFSVETYEINRLCSLFLEWKRYRQNLQIIMHTESATIIKEFDLLWCMDTIEHLKYPIEALSPFLKKCRFFVYDTEFSGNSGGFHPFHFQHDEDELQKGWQDLGFIQIENLKTETSFKVFERKSRD